MFEIEGKGQMSLKAFNYGANAVCLVKNNYKYGMICSWAMQVDYDKILLLIGSQSITGQMIEKGDIIGVSALSKGQDDILNILGEGHSNVIDKFAKLDYFIDSGAILINNASINMIIEVTDVLHLPGIEEDKLIYGFIKSYKVNNFPMLTPDL